MADELFLRFNYIDNFNKKERIAKEKGKSKKEKCNFQNIVSKNEQSTSIVNNLKYYNNIMTYQL